MCNIDYIMYLIDWNRSLDEQQKGIQLAKEVKCLKAFFQPCGPSCGKKVWENCARILADRTDEELLPYIFDLILWLQDANWPGADVIVGRLQQFENVIVLVHWIERLVPFISSTDDNLWLISIAELLLNPDIKRKLNDETVHLLLDALALLDDEV